MHAEMPVKNDGEADHPIQVGRDAVPMLAKEDLLGGHAAPVDGDIVEGEPSAVVRDLSSFHDSTAEKLPHEGTGPCYVCMVRVLERARLTTRPRQVSVIVINLVALRVLNQSNAVVAV